VVFFAAVMLNRMITFSTPQALLKVAARGLSAYLKKKSRE